MSVTIRDAAPGDAAVVLFFIKALAEYERLAHEVVASAADIERELFGPSPKVFCQLAEVDGQPAGFALWYYTFSTFQGRHGIWLEDLFVNPQMRGHGVGKALLANLAQRCVSEGLGRYEWAVLDWNQPSIDFYVAQGAVFMDDWRRCRISGEALDKLGAAA
ncbi:MAG: GNAT family N-acetyltransferase [Devosia sp.]|uniref:GNAT family N-acetyltransferase n=1 Tax=Devosia sp. TaxID=1871048 RepID=UPI001A52EF33|nr:GNAT family N-acetyltransferase [Devosia sp.]MBL8597697.1 GNAT family N-acetyltransferase [Devosia sp.]